MARRRRIAAGRPSNSLRPRKQRYLVVANGEVTEGEYFKSLELELGDVVVEIRAFKKDPAALAAVASQLKRQEEAISSRNGSDGFRRVFVVTDVDEFTAVQFNEAQRICKAADVELVISNPCFELWLIDHLMCCPEVLTVTKDVERKATELGIVGGSRNKHLNCSLIEGRLHEACENAARHNTEARRRMRNQLNKLDFGPWTDMPRVVEQMDRHGRFRVK